MKVYYDNVIVPTFYYTIFFDTIPALFDAETVYRFGLSRFSSKISLESCTVTSLSSCSEYEFICVVLLNNSFSVEFDLISDSEIVVKFCGSEVECNADGEGFFIATIIGLEFCAEKINEKLFSVHLFKIPI